MNKVILGLLLGAILGAFDGMTAWFTPAARAGIVGIVIGSTIKGIIAGVLIGYWLSGFIGAAHTKGVDWIRWLISIGVAALLSFAFAGFTSRRRRAL